MIIPAGSDRFWIRARLSPGTDSSAVSYVYRQDPVHFRIVHLWRSDRLMSPAPVEKRTWPARMKCKDVWGYGGDWQSVFLIS